MGRLEGPRGENHLLGRLDEAALAVAGRNPHPSRDNFPGRILLQLDLDGARAAGRLARRVRHGAPAELPLRRAGEGPVEVLVEVEAGRGGRGDHARVPRRVPAGLEDQGGPGGVLAEAAGDDEA